MHNENDIWQFFTSFQSTSVSQKYLKQCYENASLKHAEVKSYDNCYSFIYYIEHGKKYYQLANTAAVELKPVLLFYGMVQLIKACILTVDPEYPATTAVLAHGVSTRKRKKRNYSFLHDEVKLQKNGLLTHFASSLFQMKQFPFDSIKMETLFMRIPEMNETFNYIKKWKPLFPIRIENSSVLISLSLLDELKMTERRFIEFLTTNCSRSLTYFQTEGDITSFKFDEQCFSNDCYPFLFHERGQSFIPKRREHYFQLHEVIVHYLLLYNLSIICRYETEWWSELFHSYASDDLPFIHQFLTTTATKTPYLLSLYLNERRS